jgi:hypothetical protein
MAWETRNGREYYYRKHRIGSRVISEYVGSGWLADLTAAADEQERDEREAERRAWNKTKAEILSADHEVNQTMDTCHTLAKAILLVSGFHTHKGQWRRKRGRR